jgi:hypothetical protein
MLARRTCTVTMPDGRLCRAGPQLDRPFCYAHDPERASDAAEARRLGGLRRRKEGTIAIAFDLPGLDTVDGIRRVFQIALADLVGLDNSIARARALIATGGAATKLLTLGDHEQRLAALEAVVQRRRDADDLDDDSDL